MAADPPHFLHIIEESSTTNTNGNDQNAGKQNHTLFLSRYLPPRPHLELEEKEVVTQTAFGERRTVHFIDRNPPARLAIPGKLQPVELPPVLTAQDVSLKVFISCHISFMDDDLHVLLADALPNRSQRDGRLSRILGCSYEYSNSTKFRTGCTGTSSC